MPTTLPTFGARLADTTYVPRRGAYAVIIDSRRKVATLRTPVGCFLPGGGFEPGETLETTLAREIAEECGCGVEIIEPVGEAIDLLYAPDEDLHFEKRGQFVKARFVGKPTRPIAWLSLREVPKEMRQQGHAWAVHAATRLGKPVFTSVWQRIGWEAKMAPFRVYSSIRRRIKRGIKSIKKFPHRILVKWYWMKLGTLHQYEPRELKPETFPAPKTPRAEWPSLLLVTPSYQQAAYLPHTMDSVLGQDYPKLSYVVMDGGSRDGTREILEQYGPRLAHWVCEKDGGQAAAVVAGFNRGATGEIMAWLNSDDVLTPGALACVGDYFARHPEVDVLYGNRILIDEEGREIGRWVLPKHQPEALRYVDYVPQETLFWRRAAYEKVGGLDSTFHFALDWDLLLRFQAAGVKIVRVPYFLGCFRVHAAQKTSAAINSTGTAEMERIRLREFGGPVDHEIIGKYAHRVQMAGAIDARLLTWMGVRR